MKKTVFFLVGDYWHHRETIEPVKELLFKEAEWNVVFTEDPKVLLELERAPDLILTYKDPVENNRIPTPVWCDDLWTDRLFEYVGEEGTGIIFAHSSLADIGADHRLVRKMTKAVFTGHPAPCKVTFEPVRKHEILDGVEKFILAENDEHYMMSMMDDADADVIARTVSENGIQPGLWVSTFGKGRVCCFTPGHTTKILTSEDYIRVLSNAVKWCCGD